MLIDRLIKEMFTECHACQGYGRLEDLSSTAVSTQCSFCEGLGKTLSLDGKKLIEIIKEN